MFFFAAGVVAPFVHNLCTFGFFCYLYITCFFIDQKKNEPKNLTNDDGLYTIGYLEDDSLPALACQMKEAAKGGGTAAECLRERCERDL